MSYLKTHLSLIAPLLFMMFGFEFLLIINASVEGYEQRVSGEYSIILSSAAPVEEANLRGVVEGAGAELASLAPLDPQHLLDRLKDELSEKNIKSLQQQLPKFYSLKLASLPTQKELSALKTALLKEPGISQVETFEKTHDKIYSLLVLIKIVLWIILGLIILLSFVLFLKQMRIWLFEHSQRVEIMCLFGAPFWFRSFMLYRVVLFDCVLAFLILLGFFGCFFSLDFIASALAAVDLALPGVNYFLHLFLIFIATLAVCLICVNAVMFRVKR